MRHNKKINHFNEHNGSLYISTGYGISVYNLDDLEFGEGFITNTNIESFSGESKIKGVLSQQAVSGDKSIAVDKVVFAVPNLREFHGFTVKKITDNNVSVSKGRLLFENDKYIITLDKSNKYRWLGCVGWPRFPGGALERSSGSGDWRRFPGAGRESVPGWMPAGGYY